jgi:hypothetical protein
VGHAGEKLHNSGRPLVLVIKTLMITSVPGYAPWSSASPMGTSYCQEGAECCKSCYPWLGFLRGLYALNLELILASCIEGVKNMLLCTRVLCVYAMVCAAMSSQEEHVAF